MFRRRQGGEEPVQPGGQGPLGQRGGDGGRYVHVAGGENMEAQGNILDHEYEIHEGHKRVAEVSKKWFRVADTYGVDIAPGADDILILAITVVIDMMADEGR